eukprot:TRINITY_DN19267_c0_g1_i1.p1 TRINITY_DN19267_c0_g1~~TRINITY_DN19267_c0_g1_i1.p1  ORF type:complete len:195 (+),score=59.34 TRINITY_DN19267_c0_g1_i1:60-644(+)
MLGAQYNAIQPTQVQQWLQVTLKELEVVQTNYTTINTNAALIAGFAFSGCSDVDLGGASDTVRVFFYVVIVICMAANLHTVVVTTCCNVWAPNLAIRGQNPSVDLDRALDGMQAARKHVFVPFGVGIILFQVALGVISVSKLGFLHPVKFVGSVTCIVIFFIGIVSSVRSSFRLRRKFKTVGSAMAQTGYGTSV